MEEKRDFFDFAAQVWSYVVNLVYVPKCIACRCVCDEGGELCSECAKVWDSVRRIRCPVCQKTARSCKCRPLFLNETDMLGDRIMLPLAFYGKFDSRDKRDNCVRDLVYTLKTSPDLATGRFCARILSADILKLLAKSGERAEDYRITYPKRSRARLKRYGFDQGRDLAKNISKYTGIELEHCFENKTESIQKKLNALERKNNANCAYVLKDNVNAKGKKYIIVDDVITTGATLSACAKLLRENGAEMVFPVCVARTKPKKRNKLKRVPSNNPWFLNK